MEAPPSLPPSCTSTRDISRVISHHLILLHTADGQCRGPAHLTSGPHFEGIAVIDEDPYGSDGSNWYINQNNFFRAVYNFKIDLTQMPPSSGTGIHHQVSQATGLFNVHFEMRQDAKNGQQGIFMENGSGGFMSDLTFRGGRYGAYVGNQQFTFRNSSFENCQTAITQAWNWGWSYHNIRITNCSLGLDMRTSPNPESGSQGAASILAYDWQLSNVDTAFQILTPDSGTLILDNIAIENVGAAVTTGDGSTLLDGSDEADVIESWVQGFTAEGLHAQKQADSGFELEISRPTSWSTRPGHRDHGSAAADLSTNGRASPTLSMSRILAALETVPQMIRKPCRRS